MSDVNIALAQAQQIAKTGKALKTAPPHVVRDDVPRIVVPHGLRYRDAAKFCEAKANEEEAITPFIRKYECLPWPGAWAVERVLMAEYSATAPDAAEVSVPSVFGLEKVKLGVWQVAGLGTVKIGASNGTTGLDFQVVVETPRMYAAKAELLLDQIGAEIAKRELYAGAAIKLEPDENGNLFLKTPPRIEIVQPISTEDVVLPRHLEVSVFAELFLPIMEPAAVAARGVPVRRGVLLGGRPGTGKTMCARVAARMGIERGWSVWYLGDARAFERALAIAKMYQPAILVVEDIDRQLGGERNALVDRILNSLDGLSRNERLVVVCTTNNPSALPAPMIRPGRMDTCLLFDAPDAEAAERLLRKYLDGDAPESLGEIVGGLLPASIREVASRAKLHAVARAVTGKGDSVVTLDDVRSAAHTVRQQQELLERSEARRHPVAERVLHVVSHGERLNEGQVGTVSVGLAEKEE